MIFLCNHIIYMCVLWLCLYCVWMILYVAVGSHGNFLISFHFSSTKRQWTHSKRIWMKWKQEKNFNFLKNLCCGWFGFRQEPRTLDLHVDSTDNIRQIQFDGNDIILILIKHIILLWEEHTDRHKWTASLKCVELKRSPEKRDEHTREFSVKC